MKLRIFKIVIWVRFNLTAHTVLASFAYVPFKDLLAEAEYIVTGEVIDKQFQKKPSVMNRYARNAVTGKNEVVESTEYMAQFTDYEL